MPEQPAYTYENAPISPQGGVEYLCMCPEGPAGARRQDGMFGRYWCMRCGKGMGLREIDSCDTVNKTFEGLE
jgi:predicted SprT family Zn-dependent metalloprotease